MASRELTDEFLSDIALQYREHVSAGRMPAPAIASAAGAPVRTVHRWVYQARKRGLLEPGTPPGLCGGIAPRKQPGEASANVRMNVKRLRSARRLDQKDVSAKLKDVGWPMLPTVFSKIERGERRIDVDDLVALAAVLGVTPTYLLEPAPSCGTCHGAPPPGFACTECGTSADREDQ